MSKKTMRTFLLFVTLAAVLPLGLHAGTIGVSVNGACEAGSCPATPVPFNTTSTLPFDFTYISPNGDQFLINGSFSVTDSDSVGSFQGSNVYLFQVTYEGNASGGPSAADTITVQRLAFFQTSLSSADATTSLVGAFSSGIAPSSSASTCFGGTLSCLGPVRPPGSFNQLSSVFLLTDTNGAFPDDKTFTSNFGAGSPVGSFIVWGQTAPITAPVPEPAGLGLFAIGAVATALLRSKTARP